MSRANVRKRKASTRSPKPTSKPRGRAQAKKTTDEGDDTPSVDPKAISRIVWNLQRTERLVEWLENNVDDRQRLFSDSAQDAKEENRRPRTAKNAKTSFHIKMAEYIFSADENPRVRDDVRENGGSNYAKAVENRITR